MSILPPTEDDILDETGVAWREAPGYDAYLISFLGRVRSFSDDRFPDGRLVATRGRRMLALASDGKRTTKSVAQLVMLAWHTSAPSGNFTAGHLNGDRSDNRAVNLFWESRSAQNLRANRASHRECPRGHSYSGPNLAINRKGSACCRTCRRAHWWASKFRQQLRAVPFDGRLRSPITTEVVLFLAPDGRFPSGPPPLSEVRIAAARLQAQIDRDAKRLIR
jgi:hypothetical protein